MPNAPRHLCDACRRVGGYATQEGCDDARLTLERLLVRHGAYIAAVRNRPIGGRHG